MSVPFSARGVATGIPGISAAVRCASSWSSRDWFWGLVLLAAVIATYSPVWWAGYVWDDDTLLTTNPCIVGPLGLREIWTTANADICPLTLTTFWAEHKLWGLNPLPYHLVNVLLQGACAVLLWRVLRSLQVPGAWLGAALWALHPVEVASVAWIAEMKNTESGLFYLLAVLCFINWLKRTDAEQLTRWNWNYLLTIFFAALAMASKASTVILPVVLCLCAWWVEGRWQWRNLLRVAPVILLSVVASALPIYSQSVHGINPDPSLIQGWPERWAIAGDAIWFYLGKLIWPYPLMAVYPRWQIDASDWVSYLPLLAVILAWFLLWWRRGSWARGWFFAYTYFLVALVPVIGFVQHVFLQYSFVADHFQYLAGMGPLALLGAGVVRLTEHLTSRMRWAQVTVSFGIVLLCGLLSWQHTWAYQSEETLWTDAIAKNPKCWAGYYNLGHAFALKGEWDRAIPLYQKALEVSPSPNFARAHYDLGLALGQKGQINQAITHFQTAVDIKPDYADAHSMLGQVLLQQGRLDEAAIHFERLLELEPENSRAFCNLGVILAQKGQLDEATTDLQKAIEIDPNYAEAHYNLGLALYQKRQVYDAMVHLRRSLEINPNNPAAHNAVGLVLTQEGQWADATAQFEAALRLQPDYKEAQKNLAAVQAGAHQMARPK